MKTPFSHSLFPPIPALEIRLIHPQGAPRSAYLHAFLDTGSDATIVPVDRLEEIELAPSRWEVVYGMWGGQEQVPIFTVDIAIGELTFSGVNVIGHYEDYVLVGRDLSNQLRLLLDGPAKTVEMME